MEELNDLGRPPGVTNRLHSYRWEPGSGGCGKLTLPAHYARLFDCHLGGMTSIKGLTWQREEVDNTCTLHIETLNSDEKSQNEEFIDAC